MGSSVRKAVISRFYKTSEPCKVFRAIFSLHIRLMSLHEIKIYAHTVFACHCYHAADASRRPAEQAAPPRPARARRAEKSLSSSCIAQGLLPAAGTATAFSPRLPPRGLTKVTERCLLVGSG